SSAVNGARSAVMIAFRIDPKSMLLKPLNVIGEPMVVLLFARTEPTRAFAKGEWRDEGAVPLHPAWLLRPSGARTQSPEPKARARSLRLPKQREDRRAGLVRLRQGRDARLAQDVEPGHVGRLLRDVRVTDSALSSLLVGHLRLRQRHRELEPVLQRADLALNGAEGCDGGGDVRNRRLGCGLRGEVQAVDA